MSGQPEAEVITSLDDLFASREFGQLLPVPPEPEALFTGHLRGMRVPRSVVPTAVAGGWRGHPARERATALVSGVAAAALVLAGLAAGTTHHPPRGVSALGATTHSKGGGIRGVEGSGPNPSTISPGATNAAATVERPGAGAGGSAVFVAAPSAPTTPTTPRQPVAVVPAAAPSPAPPNTSTPSGGVPAPPPGAANPLMPVVTVVTSSTGTVGSALSTASSAMATGAVPGATPSTAPATAAVGNLGSAVNAALA